MRAVISKIILLFLHYTSIGGDTNLYWREYTGIVPEDAVPGGYDINHQITYIGQGYVLKYGIIVGMIYPGKSLNVEMRGAKAVDSYEQILCSTNQEAFKWIPATAQTFHEVVKNKKPVQGGYEILESNNSYALDIGRIAFQGELVVGKIVTASPETPGKAPMYYVSNNKGFRIDSYEALVYEI